MADIAWWMFEYDFDHMGNISEVYSFTNQSWVSGPNLIGRDGTEYLARFDFCTIQLNKTHSMLIGGLDLDTHDSTADVILYDWTKGEWTLGHQEILTAAYLLDQVASWSQVDVSLVVVKALLQQRFMTLKSTLGTTVRMCLQILIMVESLSTGTALLY